jgi:saccharopepsin
VGSFIPQAVAVGKNQLSVRFDSPRCGILTLFFNLDSDLLVGDNVLRSIYSIFDFGDFDSSDKMGDPYVQLLSLVDPDAASKEFASERGSTARTGIKYPTTDGAANSASHGTANGSTVSVSDDVSTVITNLGKYLPALAGVIALNAVLLLVLLCLAIWFICTKGRKESKKRVTAAARPRSNVGRTTPRALTPMPMDDYNYEPPQPLHHYEPVSMALSEADTVMVPPSAGFKYDPDGAKGLQRPHSYASGRSGSGAYPPSRPIPVALAGMPEDQPFQPPSPGFHHTYEGNAGDRPKSYA